MFKVTISVNKLFMETLLNIDILGLSRTSISKVLAVKKVGNFNPPSKVSCECHCYFICDVGV